MQPQTPSLAFHRDELEQTQVCNDLCQGLFTLQYIHTKEEFMFLLSFKEFFLQLVK